MINFFLYYLYTMQKNTKIALISGSIIAISLGVFLWYKSKKKQSEESGGDVVSDLEKIYNQLLAGSGSGIQQGTASQQSTQQQRGQDESQRQSYKEPTSQQPSTSAQQANQKQLEQQKKKEEDFFKPKDTQQQPQNPFANNDAQYNMPAYGTSDTGGYSAYGSNRDGSGYGYGSNWGTYGSGFWDRDRGYGGNISDY